MAWRPAFTLIEIMVVLTIVAIVSAAAINSGLRTRQNTVFQGDFQKFVLLIQDLRSKALNDKNILNKGFGLSFYNDGSAQIIFSFIDKDGNGIYNKEIDDSLQSINLASLATIGMAFKAYEFVPESKYFNLTADDSGNTATVFFPTQAFNCSIKTSLDDNPANDIAYLEVVFANTNSADFEELAEENVRQLLSFHHLSCNPEISKDSLL